MAEEQRQEAFSYELPKGYILWFHSTALPQCFLLASPSSTTKLLTPPPDGPSLNPKLPTGLVTRADEAAIDAALNGNPKLAEQLEALVPLHLSYDQFFLNYFAHVHQIKSATAATAWEKANSATGLTVDERRFCAPRPTI